MFAAISLIAFQRPVSPPAATCRVLWVYPLEASSVLCSKSKPELDTVDISDSKSYKARCLVLANTRGQKTYQYVSKAT